jgi:hypothetical protein
MNEHPFSFEELHDKTVEYQTHGRATAFARLRAKKFPDGRIEVSLNGVVGEGVTPAPPETLDPKHLIRHPATTRADFLWAIDVDYLRRWF